MSQLPTSKHRFKNWLESLQRESWQLELLVTGFAIVLLIGASELIQDAFLNAEYLRMGLEDTYVLNVLLILMLSTWIFLLINLLLHVLLRGLWISTIGLRSVSGDIRLQHLKFKPRFERFLVKRMPSFDMYIDRLDRLSSVVFAFTFLILFSILSFGLFTISLYLLASTLEFILAYFFDAPSVVDHIVKAFRLVFLLVGFISFIDFITLGLFKRKKWTARWYYPLYVFMGWITLSFLYRPIYYNLIDNKFGKRIGLLLVPYIILVAFLTSLYFETHPYYPTQGLEKWSITDIHYDNKREEGKIISHPCLASPYISNGFLEVFIPYIPNKDDKVIQHLCPSLQPHKTGLTNDLIIVNSSNTVNDDSLAQQSLSCFTKIYQIEIADSTITAPAFFFYEHHNLKEKGLKTVLDIDYLDRGPYQLVISKARVRKDSLFWKDFASIPFWKE
jgi:hypothetical protein